MDSSLPCISHIATFRQNNLIAWKGRPRCLHLKTKRALNSIFLLSLLLLDKSEDLALEMRDLTELLGISCGQRETSSEANIAQVDCVPAWLGEFRDLINPWSVGSLNNSFGFI